MNNWKADDWVTCVNDSPVDGRREKPLTCRKDYKVISLDGSWTRIIDDKGENYGFLSDRFVKSARTIRKEKLLKIEK